MKRLKLRHRSCTSEYGIDFLDFPLCASRVHTMPYGVLLVNQVMICVLVWKYGSTVVQFQTLQDIQ